MKKLVVTTICSIVFFGSFHAFSQTAHDEFVFNNSAEPETLDPHRLSTHNDSLLSLQMFEGLVTLDKDYQSPRPGVAEKWDISKDGKTYIFTIKPNLKWSNGEPLTLEQIRGSFVRVLDPNVATPYLFWFTDTIVGAKELNEHFKDEKRKETEENFGVKIKGKNQIQITLKNPSPPFLQYLTQPAASIVHPSMYASDAKAWNQPEQFISNGPYKLSAWKVNQMVELVKNPHYPQASQIKINKIVALAINDESATLNLYRTKKLDWTGEASLSSTKVPSLRGDPDFRLAPYFGTAMYCFNVKKKPFDDARVRKALSLVVHRAELVDKVLKGGQISSTNFVPTGLKDYPYDVKVRPPFDKQIDEAKALLASAGFPDGKNFPKVTITYNTQEQNHRIAQAIQQMWKKYLNIDVTLQNMEWKVFVQLQQSHQFDIARNTWIADAPDPAQMLEIFVTGNTNNYTDWSNPKFDQLFREASTTMDRKKRFSLYAKAEKIVLEELPAFPMYHSVYFSLLSPSIEGFTPNMFGKYQVKFLSKK